MSNFKLTREEQETVILGNAASQTWDICTADPRIIRKLEKQGYKPDDRPNPWGYVSFTLPLDRVKIAKAERRRALGRPFQPKSPAIPRVDTDQPPILSLTGEGDIWL
jgi:hypothetical protein